MPRAGFFQVALRPQLGEGGAAPFAATLSNRGYATSFEVEAAAPSSMIVNGDVLEQLVRGPYGRDSVAPSFGGSSDRDRARRASTRTVSI